MKDQLELTEPQRAALTEHRQISIEVVRLKRSHDFDPEMLFGNRDELLPMDSYETQSLASLCIGA